MAAREKKAGALSSPAYLHRPAATVALQYPFTLNRIEYRRVNLNPPSLQDIQAIRFMEAIRPEAIVNALTGIPEEAINCFRWTDVEAVLQKGKALLPPDLFEPPSMGGSEATDAAQETPDAIAPDGIADETDPGSPADFLIDPVRDGFFVER